jgi:predicted NACHT family NTPase
MTIPWKRFWSPLGGTIYCGENGKGFLVDPEDSFGLNMNPGVFELTQLLDRQCLILLGEPGMGKSTTILSAKPEIERGFSEGKSCLWVDFREVPDTNVFYRRTLDSTVWKAWVNGTDKLTLVVDGIDEGVIKIPSFVAFLAGELESVDRSRLQVIMVCRTADWPQAEGQRLQLLWPDDPEQQQFEIAPLRHKDVQLAAEHANVNRESFIQAVHEHHVVGLANRPVTLFMLLREFDSTGGFPGTHRDLYKLGCHRLCSEINQARLELLRRIRPTTIRPPDDQMYRTACRLAAVLILSGKSSILTVESTQASPSDITLSVVARGSESIGRQTFPVHESLILETLGTALFSSRGENRYGFSHQTFMEAMAAEYLRDFPLAQITQLVCQYSGGEEHVVPQLAELASWLAGENAPFCEYLIEREPETVLRSDIGVLSPEQRPGLSTDCSSALKTAKRSIRRVPIIFTPAWITPNLARNSCPSSRIDPAISSPDAWRSGSQAPVVLRN